MDRFAEAWNDPGDTARRSLVVVYTPGEGLTDDQRRRLEARDDDDPPVLFCPGRTRVRTTDSDQPAPAL